jgi:hypothetical protein
LVVTPDKPWSADHLVDFETGRLGLQSLMFDGLGGVGNASV